PEIRRDGPGHCPICGMALEPLEPTVDEAPNPELIDMSRRFWMSVALTLPLLRSHVGVAQDAQPQHVHADRPRRRSCLRLQPRRRPCAAHFSRIASND